MKNSCASPSGLPNASKPGGFGAIPLLELIKTVLTPSYGQLLEIAQSIEEGALEMTKSAVRMIDELSKKSESPDGIPTIVWVQLSEQRRGLRSAHDSLQQTIDQQLSLPRSTRAPISDDEWEEIIKLTVRAEQILNTIDRICGQQ